MPVNDFPVVTICGSMRFYSRMLFVAEGLSKRGCIVLMPFVAFSPGEQQSSSVKRMLDDMHFVKISMSDAVVIVTDESGYYGESTRNELRHAEKTGKRINYYHLAERKVNNRLTFSGPGEWIV